MNSAIRIALVLGVSMLGITYFSALPAQEKDAPTAAKLDGAWEGRVGKRHYNFEFKNKEGVLTGTVTPPDGKPVAIAEGEVDGDDFAFRTVEEGKKWTWSGYIDSGKLEGEREGDDDDSFETFNAEMKR